MKNINKVMAICAIIMLTILCLSTHYAEAIQYCRGGLFDPCIEVSGWKTVVTGVSDISGGHNLGGVCSLEDFPFFRPNTKAVTFIDITCEGEPLQSSFLIYCVNFTPPSVGEVVSSNCTRILEKVSGDGQAGTINSTLPQPLVVKVADNTGIQINWTITGPQGATGMSVSPQTGTQVAVKLGDKPGPYAITATCTGCTSGSSVTFTATATATDKILSIVSGDGQSGVMETMLKEPLVIKVTDSSGNPKDGVTINWAITKVPVGAIGAVLGSPESATNQDGLAGAFLTLGDTEDDYQVTATCPDCASSSSQVVFTAKARCAIDNGAITPLSQCAETPVNLKETQYDSIDKKICDRGCTIGAIAMVLNFYGASVDIVAINDFLKRKDINGFADGDVLWPRINQFLNLPVVYDMTHHKSKDEKFIKQQLREGRPVILDVFNNTTKRNHFVVAFCKNGSTYKIWDPAHGDVTTLARYNNQFIGIRFFKPK